MVRMTKEVVAKDVPTIEKLSNIIVKFERFGDVIKASMDERKRKSSNVSHVFITFADDIHASRAVEAGSIDIRGMKIKVEPYTERKDVNSRFNFIREGKITAIERNRSAGPPNKRHKR